ncbi:unnamed protein product [Auanema sp. JU1783]|nr:unnamed protein product [Auanema sp. JU1783]
MTSQPVIVTTGNVNSLTEIVTKRHKNSAEEVQTALKHYADIGKQFVLEKGVFAPSQDEQVNYAASDMKITLKVFLSEFSPKEIQSAVSSFLAFHSVTSVSQLIVSFPYLIAEDLSDEEWLGEVLNVWAIMESLVDEGVVHTLGVADLDVDRMKLLTDNVKKYRPSINHYSIDGCCAVASELSDFAKQHDIQLLTHNDCRSLAFPETLKSLVSTIVGQNLDAHHDGWASRYTIWVRSRSVLAEKGFFVQFKL